MYFYLADMIYFFLKRDNAESEKHNLAIHICQLIRSESLYIIYKETRLMKGGQNTLFTLSLF